MNSIGPYFYTLSTSEQAHRIVAFCEVGSGPVAGPHD